MDEEVVKAVEATIAAGASKATTVGGAGGALLAWFMSSQAIAAISLLIAVLGFAVNFYFRLRSDRRAERESQARLAALARGVDAPPAMRERDES